jgi:Mn-dependent DtxR family transcriptional regulator
MITNSDSKVTLTKEGEAAAVEIVAAIHPIQEADFSNVNVNEVLKELSDLGLVKVEPEPVFKGFGKKS